MAGGMVKIYRELILCILVCAAQDASGGRRAPARIEAVVPIGSSHKWGHEQELLRASETKVELWGSGLSRGLEAGLTATRGVQGAPCRDLVTPPLILNPETVTPNHAVFTVMPAHTSHISARGKKVLWLCTRDQHTYTISGRARHTGGWIHQGPPSRLVVVETPQRTAHRLSLRSVERPPPAGAPPEAASRGLDGNVSTSDRIFPAEGDIDVRIGSQEALGHVGVHSESEAAVRTTTFSYVEGEEDAGATTVEGDPVSRTTTLPSHLMRETEEALLSLKNNQSKVEGNSTKSNTEEPYVEGSTEYVEGSTEGIVTGTSEGDVGEQGTRLSPDVMLGDMPSPEASSDVSRTSDTEETDPRKIISDEARTSSGRAGVRASDTFVDRDKEAVELSDVLMNLMNDEVVEDVQPDPGNLQSGNAPGSLQSGNAPGSLQSGNAPGSLQSGNASGSLQSGNAPGSLRSGNAPGSLQSGNAPGSFQSGNAPGSLQSGNAPGSLRSGNAPGSLQSGNAPGSLQSGDISESPDSPRAAASSDDSTSEGTVPTGTQSDGLIKVIGLRVEAHGKGIEYEDLSGSVLSNTDAKVRFFGEGITLSTQVLFTAYDSGVGTNCGAHTTKAFKMTEVGEGWATATIRLPSMTSEQKRWYLCVRATEGDQAYHQGSDPWLTMTSYNLPLPLWLQVCFIIVLLVLSGLFSGLNLGLMALDKTELKIVSNTGSPEEQRYARAIEPVRRHGNFLLCTLLLGNVLVNSSLTILLDELSSGLIAVIGSTIGIVIFGEIIPQAICSRHGLAIGARTVWLVRVFMVITGVVSYPISKILDLVLGEEIGNTYDRERLKELIKVTHDHNDLRKEEQNIICGALELHKKTVGEVMTKLDDVYMLSVETSLDFNTINEIMKQGYSRVPVYEGEHTNIITVLFTKDLAFIDPDDNTPLKTLCQFYQNPCNFVFVDTTLDVMFKEFKEGAKGHMAFVQRVNNEGDCDPFYEVLGLVTLEDVIEELIQEEIVDETDVFTDNRSKRRRQHIGRPDFTEFSHPGNQANHKRVQISPQMQVAALQYLRTSIEPFKEGQLSEMIVKKLLNQDVIHSIKLRNKELSKTDQHTYIYTQGKPVDYFALILEGHVEVTIGKENLTFESGPFTYFGMAALSHVQPIGESPSASTQLSKGSIVGSVQSLDSTKFSFTPDYSVRGVTDVMYLKIQRSHYIAAHRAYLLEQAQREPHAEEHFEKEMAKMLIEDDGPSSPAWENTMLAASNNKESSAMANGCAVKALSTDIEMTHHNIGNGFHKNSPSPAAPSSGIKNSISVPGTPVSGHSSGSMKPSNSFTNLHKVPALVGSVSVNTAQKNNQKPLILETGSILLTNNLSTSSIEDNGEQNVVGNPDVMPNMNRLASLDYKRNNFDIEGVFDHKSDSSFS